MKHLFATATLVASLCAAPVLAASSGAVVAVGDEWLFSDLAFDGGSVSGDSFTGDRTSAEALTSNLAAALGGTNYLIATDNAYGYGSDFETYLSGTLGKSVSRTTTQAGFDAGLAAADAVFLVGAIGSASRTALDAFVANGGSVVVSLGAGLGGSAAAEAGAWNPFLQTYGLTAATSYSTFARFTPLTVSDGASSLDDGVSTILWGYGNQISLFGTASGNSLVSGVADGLTVSAIGMSPAAAPVPLPAGAVLLVGGLAAFGALRRTRS